ncbi:MAG: membrane protein insertase YidC [candidate division KSB1 bacterium]|nr:membrane protein insertase YidC [candidate division KSB1 bacterium]MDZ7392355.1 membrane protein insertase YidC [candidate division KSB1 bacterium]MDZ7412131.1 membrane protein insertase YidC [candidate division KSB1 bacterium]
MSVKMDKNTVIGVLLIILMLILVNTPFYKKTFFPQQYWQEQIRNSQRQAPAEVDSVLTPPPVEERSEAAPTVPPATIAAAAQRVEGEEVVVETPLFRLSFNTRGAVLTACQMKHFKDPDSNFVQMLAGDSAGNLALGFTTARDSVDTGLLLFRSDVNALSLGAGDSGSVTFIGDLGEGRQIVKRYMFRGDSYYFGLDIRLENFQNTIAQRRYTVGWRSGLAPTEAKPLDDFQEAKVYALFAGNLEKFDIGRGPAKSGAMDGVVHWVGARTKYFAAAIIPTSQRGVGMWYQGRRQPPPRSFAIWDRHRLREVDRLWKSYAFGLDMSFLNEPVREDRFLVFLGPLDYSTVRGPGVGLERMMSLGWKVIQPFSKAVLWCLKTLHRVIPNYGWVIVVFSLLVKVVLYPLTHSSLKSMHKMQELQPRLVALREKYGKDPQRLNEETMKLYKEAGVNPMGGCLPLLLQMPLLYALFVVFRNTISFRGQGFVFWIKDLANPDTVAVLPFSLPLYGNLVNILPLVMGVTMLIQQKMSVKDPKQKMMVYFMPIFFTLLFNSFPSGLNLYYMLFNVLSIIQQKVVTDRLLVAKKEVAEKKPFLKRPRRR